MTESAVHMAVLRLGFRSYRGPLLYTQEESYWGSLYWHLSAPTEDDATAYVTVRLSDHKQSEGGWQRQDASGEIRWHAEADVDLRFSQRMTEAQVMQRIIDAFALEGAKITIPEEPGPDYLQAVVYDAVYKALWSRANYGELYKPVRREFIRADGTLDQEAIRRALTRLKLPANIEFHLEVGRDGKYADLRCPAVDARFSLFS